MLVSGEGSVLNRNFEGKHSIFSTKFIKKPFRYFNLSAEEAMGADVPLLFISFPSTKDPEWDNHPGRKGKHIGTRKTPMT